MKVFVTGGAGFIGSHVVRRLVESRGCRVAVFDDFNDFYDPCIKRANLAELPADRLTVFEGDIRDADAVSEAVGSDRFDAVIHLAARAGVRPSILDPGLYVTTNVNGTLNVLEAARHSGIRQFIFASSSSVYGVNRKVPFAESDPIERTISPYAATKLAGEQLCSNYACHYGLRCICLRFFTVYGPGQRPDLAISKFTRMIDEGTPIDKYGDGSSQRDYTFIDDIVDGVMGALDYTETDFEIANLGGAHSIALNDLIKVVEAAVGKPARIRQLPDQPGDVPRTSADVTKAKQLFGFEPQVPIEEGVRRYVEWYRSLQPAHTVAASDAAG